MTIDTEKSYGVYVHIPFCKAKCKYCAFVSTPDFSLQKTYVDALIKEINDSPFKDGYVDTVYIGGGTPSCLFRGGLADIMSAVRNNFRVSDSAEITVECNPESVSTDFIAECKDCGVNRISIGLQSSCDNVLRAIGRVHTYADYIKAVDLLSRSFDNISSDIILGLPEQTSDDVINSITTVARYCSHVSVYALTVEDGTPLYNEGYSPSDDGVADLYDLAYDKLSELCFARYEVSNFALNGRESKHNKKYWECMPYIGFGVAAHGYDGARTRFLHGDDITKYIASPTAESYALTDKDLYNEYVMLRMRTEKGIVTDDFRKRFGYDFNGRNAEALSILKSEKLLICTDGAIRISPDKMFVMNSIIEQLMLD
ncbi:MAG: radical SAM family heme chaperone HemW [Clostridiales bacterium]|nr:radical SAM family heme chaperone HemW [Clostridiales bacterium]